MREKNLVDRTIEYYRTLPKPCEEDLYHEPLPPLRTNEWEKILNQLGFNPGSFIRSLYLTIGGGFVGPGYGSLRADTVDETFSLVGYYLSQRNENKRYPSWYWPEGLLALIDWGCTIVSCVDCTTDQLEVIRFNPDFRSERPRDWSRCFRAEAGSLYEWWERWLAGEDLWVDDGLTFPRWGRYLEIVSIEQIRRRKRKRRISSNQLGLDFDTE